MWKIIFLWIFVSSTVGATATVISSFPYLETFDSTPKCSPCSTGGLETDCLQIETDLGWIQDVGSQDSAPTNWIVWSGDSPTLGTGPQGGAGDHTSGSGHYMWIHQGTGSTYSPYGSGAPYCEPSPIAFVTQDVGIVSPVFNFSQVSTATDHVFLRFWYWMYGVRTGTLTVQMSTTGSVDGPWDVNLTSIGLSPPEWLSEVVELPGVQGLDSVRLRFVAHFLPTYCPGGVDPFCVYTGTSPHPDDMADQAFDDVEIFLSSDAPTVTPGTEQKAIWVDLSERYDLSSVLPFASQQEGGWFNYPTPFGIHRMNTWGGVSASGEAISTFRIFDYVTRSYVYSLDTGQVPLPRQRSAFVTFGSGDLVNLTKYNDPLSHERLVMYGGRGKFGITQDVLMMDSLSGIFEPSGGPINCTDLTPGQRSHATFPSEGSKAVLNPLDPDGTTFYVTMGRSLVVQVNFITEYVISNTTSGTCTSQALLPSSGASPPFARWQHVVGAWKGPNANSTYLFIFGGRFQPSDNDPTQVLRDVAIFDVVSKQWLSPPLVADPSKEPSGRYGAAAATNKAGDKLVLFGGIQQDGSVVSDVYVLQYNLKYALWEPISPGLDVDSVPGRAYHLMLPMFFDDYTLDPTAPDNETGEGFMVYGGILDGGQVSNHMAKLHFGNLDLTKLKNGGGGSTPTIAIVLGVILPFCCMLLLLISLVGIVIGLLITWRVRAKHRLKQKYGIGQDIPLNVNDSGDEEEGL